MSKEIPKPLLLQKVACLFCIFFMYCMFETAHAAESRGDIKYVVDGQFGYSGKSDTQPLLNINIAKSFHRSHNDYSYTDTLKFNFGLPPCHRFFENVIVIYNAENKTKLNFGNHVGIAFSVTPHVLTDPGIYDYTRNIQKTLDPLYVSQIHVSPHLWSNQYGYGIHRRKTFKMTLNKEIAHSWGTTLLGISYTPVLNYYGTQIDYNDDLKGIAEHEKLLAYNNILQFGISQIEQLTDSLTLKGWINFEIGRSKNNQQQILSAQLPANMKVFGMLGLETGLYLGYKGFWGAINYGNIYQSGKIAKVEMRNIPDSYFLTYSLGYEIGAFNFSIQRFQSYNYLGADLAWDGIIIANNPHSSDSFVHFEGLSFQTQYKITSDATLYASLFTANINSKNTAKSMFKNKIQNASIDSSVQGALFGIRLTF